MKRVLITGDRNWQSINVATIVLSRLSRRYGERGYLIVHGDASGVDAAFEDKARSLRIRTEPHPADWETLGRRAGPVRNGQMVAAGADFAIAVHRELGRSKGTRDCVEKCLAAGIPVYWIRDNNAEPLRVRGFDGVEVLTGKGGECDRLAAS